MPLRTTVGKPLNIKSVQVISAADGLGVQSIQQKRWLGMDAEYLNDPTYAKFLPDQVMIGNSAYGIGPGVGVMTRPSDLPFTPESFYSLWTLADVVSDEDLSRQLWVEYRLTLAARGDALVGGICYGGYPYMPYYITPQGENSSNFGLPREIRVSWAGQHGNGFLDDDVSLTQQEAASHSGVHVFPTGPVITNQLRIRLSDFPRIITGFEGDRVVERWGFIIPYFFVYGYKERTRFQARVPAGLLGAVQTWSFSPPGRQGRPSPYYFDRQLASNTPGLRDKYASGCPDYLLVKNNHYFPSAGAGIFQDTSSRRQYVLDRGTIIDEHFGSNKLAQNSELYLCVEQAEEQPRCLAGLRISFGGNEQGDPLAVRMRVYELDPPEGVSPLALSEKPDHNKYATLIATLELPKANPNLHQVRFVRPSSSRYFVLVFQALDEGYLFINSLELVQSVHVSVTPRASRAQIVSAMHFRLIGPDLAEDYARLGSDGFSFSVEHLVAGQTKNVLFSANSLLDLLQIGAARLYSNHRRRMAEHEITKTVEMTGEKNYARQCVRSEGWSRAQTGEDFGPVIPPSWYALGDPRPDPTNAPDDFGFYRREKNESRVHTEHVGYADAEWVTLMSNLLGAPLAGEWLGDLNRDPDALWKNENGTVWVPWQISDTSRLAVNGVWNVNRPVYFQLLWEAIKAVLNTPGYITPAEMASVAALINQHSLKLFLINGLGVSVGQALPIGTSGSVSANVGVPTLLKSSSSGTTGVINQQASKSGYSFAQYLNDRFESTRTEFPEGKMEHLVTRSPAGKDTERIKGAEVMWQEQLVDIVTGTIPLNVALPATAGNIYRTTDEVIRVRLGGGFRESLSVDVWFDVREEAIRDDY